MVEHFSNYVNVKPEVLDFANSYQTSMVKSYDVILMRHPEPFGGERTKNDAMRVWARIFANAKLSLKPGGLLIITSYWKAEMEFFCEIEEEPEIELLIRS